MAGPVKIAIVGDPKDFKGAMTETEKALEHAETAAKKSGARIGESLDKVSDGAGKVASLGAQAAGALNGLGDLVGGPFGAGMKKAGTAIQAAADAGDLLEAGIQGAKSAAALGSKAMDALRKSTILQSVATKAAAIAQRAFNIAMSLNPIGLIVLAVIALIAGIVLLYKKNATFKAFVDKAWKGIQAVIGAVVSFIQTSVVPFFTTTLPAAFKAVVDWVTAHWPLILSILTGPIGAAVIAIVTHWDEIKAATSAAWNAIVKLVTGILDKIKKFFANVGKAYVVLLTGTWSKIKNAAAAAWNAVKSAIFGVLLAIGNYLLGKTRAIVSTLSGAWARIRASVSSAWAAVRNAISAAMARVVSTVTSKVNSIVSKITGIPGRIRAIAGQLWSAGYQLFSQLAGGLKAKWNEIAGWVTAKLQWFRDHLPGSPVKIGPLKAFNNGRAGKLLMKMLADGITDGAHAIDVAMDKALNMNTTVGIAPALAGAGAGGPRIVNVTVQAPVGSSPAEIGRTIQRALDAYTQAGGRSRA